MHWGSRVGFLVEVVVLIDWLLDGMASTQPPVSRIAHRAYRVRPHISP